MLSFRARYYLQNLGLGLGGILVALVIVEVAMRLAGLVLLFVQDLQNEARIDERGVYTILCLGESTTARGGRDSWPAQLEVILNEKDLGVEFNVVNKGVEGTNSGVLLSQLETNLDVYEPDLVVTMIGVNDAGATVRFDNSRAARLEQALRGMRLYKLGRFFYLALTEEAPDATREPRRLPGKVPTRQPGMSAPPRRASARAPGEAWSAPADPEQTNRLFEAGHRAYRAGRFEEAERLLLEAREDPNAGLRVHVTLGNLRFDRRDFAGAEEAYERALAAYPNNEATFVELGILYRTMGDSEKLFELAERIRGSGLYSDRMFAFVARVYRERGMLEEYREFQARADAWRVTNFDNATSYNYGKIADTVTSRGIRLICMQYPLRRLESLIRVLANRPNIIYLSNREPFEEALERRPYGELFTDNFGGDFGHATRAGNRLIAQNVARVVEDLVK